MNGFHGNGEDSQSHSGSVMCPDGARGATTPMRRTSEDELVRGLCSWGRLTCGSVGHSAPQEAGSSPAGCAEGTLLCQLLRPLDLLTMSVLSPRASFNHSLLPGYGPANQGPSHWRLGLSMLLRLFSKQNTGSFPLQEPWPQTLYQSLCPSV